MGVLDTSRVFGTLSADNIPLKNIPFEEEQTNILLLYKVGLDIFACSLLIQL